MNFENRPTHSLRPYSGNARTHSPKQIKQIARSIERFGFNNPVLVDDDNQIIAGHGRVEAAKLLNMKTVPTVRLSHLSESEKKAYILADNRLAEKAGWDNEVLAIELQGLVDLGFDVLLTGFEPAEVDIIIEGIGDESEQPENLVPEETSDPAVSRLGDVWTLGKHILVCGDSTDAATYKLLMDDEKAEFVFTDPPYNVKIDGNVSGLGRVKHGEFPMASGEMSESQFTAFPACTPHFASIRPMARSTRSAWIGAICEKCSQPEMPTTPSLRTSASGTSQTPEWAHSTAPSTSSYLCGRTILVST
jgi:hypothetical protein